MKIETINATVLKLTDLDRLDPVRVVIEDIEAGKGRIIITCYGKAWTAYWGGMGSKTIAQFFCSCDEHYLASNLSSTPATVTDYCKISNDTGSDVEEKTLFMYADEIAKVYGDHWFMDLPETENPDYAYLCRIIKAVQAGLQDQSVSEAA